MTTPQAAAAPSRSLCRHLTKSVVQTSEASTAGSNVAVGEIVRYHLTATLPEGTENALQFLDSLPAGLSFINDGTATVALVSINGSSITSSTLATTDVSGDALGAVGNTANGTPLYVLPGSAVSQPNGIGDGKSVVFSLGNLLNLEPRRFDAVRRRRVQRPGR